MRQAAGACEHCLNHNYDYKGQANKGCELWVDREPTERRNALQKDVEREYK